MKVQKCERNENAQVEQCQCQRPPSGKEEIKGKQYYSNTKINSFLVSGRTYVNTTYVCSCSMCVREEKKTKSRRRGPSDC